MTVSPPASSPAAAVTPVARARADPAQLIDGTWAGPDGQPGHETSPAAISRAVAAAWRDHRGHLLGIGTPAERAAALHAAAGRLDALAEEIAVQDTLDSGVPIAVTRLFAGSLGGTLRGAAGRIPDLAPEDLSTGGRAVRLHHLPLGPAAVLAPWNAPTAIAAKKAAFAWAAGCPVIIKPSPWSPSGTTVLARALHEAAREAGLPRASIQLVLGGTEAGQALISSPRVRAVSFTGSRAGGRAVAATAIGGLAALHFELGSNNPAVVLPDAGIEATAAALAAGMVKLNGAWCESPGTVFVPAGLRDDLVDALVRQLGKQVIGDPFDESVTFGA
jgi:phenylacetaldehyde dehydrogenase